MDKMCPRFSMHKASLHLQVFCHYLIFVIIWHLCFALQIMLRQVKTWENYWGPTLKI